MAAVSSCRETLGSAPERAKPLPLVGSWDRGKSHATFHDPGTSLAGPPGNLEEGGDDDKSARPSGPGPHTCYNGRYRGLPSREAERNPKNRSRLGLQAATRLHERGAASNRRSANGGECVTGPRTSSTPCPGCRLRLKPRLAREVRKDSVNRRGQGGAGNQGYGRSKVAVPEGVAGIPLLAMVAPGNHRRRCCYRGAPPSHHWRCFPLPPHRFKPGGRRAGSRHRSAP